MKEKYLEDLKEIKEIMYRSSRFISLSGWSGVSAGIIALIGAYLAYQMVYSGRDYQSYRQVWLSNESLFQLILIALGTTVVAIGTVVYFTTRETKKRNQQVWDAQTKRLLINLFIPLIAGGILCLMFLFKGYVGFVPSFTLIFYGLALVNASKYTLNELRSLGLLEIALGLIAIHLIESGLLFWAVGFGFLHIVYGVMMHLKYR